MENNIRKLQKKIFYSSPLKALCNLNLYEIDIFLRKSNSRYLIGESKMLLVCKIAVGKLVKHEIYTNWIVANQNNNWYILNRKV